MWRLAGCPIADNAAAYEDVEADAYYANAIAWANQNGIVSGYSEKEFKPNDAIGRDQLATILYRYAKYNGYDTTARENLNGFMDEEQIPAYAKEAMEWAVAEGIFSGDEMKRLNPAASANRAETASVLMRFIEKLEK